MTTHAEQRAAVVAEARSWLGTPYHHHARLKHVGVDCAQLPIAVYSTVGLIHDIQPKYSEQWMLHRAEELYLGWVRQFAHEVDGSETGPGDFAVWRVGRTYSHGAIITGPDRFIHALRLEGRVLEGGARECGLSNRPVLFFSPWSA